MIENMIANMARQWGEKDLELYFIQVAKGDNYKFELISNCKGCVTSSSKTKTKDSLTLAIELLEFLYKELCRREDIIQFSAKRSDEDFNLNIHNKKHPDKKISALVLLIDEASSLFEVDSGMEVKERKQRARASRICQEIAKRGRSVGFNIIISQQRATKDELPRAIKINCSNKLTFNQTDESASFVAIDDKQAALGLLPQVFAYKSGTNKVYYGKTPTSNWNKQIRSIKETGRIRKDNDEFIKSFYKDWLVDDNSDNNETYSQDDLSDIKQEIVCFRESLGDFVYKNSKQQKDFISKNSQASKEMRLDDIKIKIK